ncbi:hypothetical protein L4C54_03755 [Vibrio lamellibrachiae]|uniref:hypothetical protein n=1 Tax=Vibrio lamellibrachiae TaxID=2910253 RepID=UPI003D13B9A3
MELSDDAIIITPAQFKKVCRNLRNRFDIISSSFSLSQLQQQLAKSLGFSSYQTLKLNDNIIVELEYLRKSIANKFPYEGSIQRGIHNELFADQPYLVINSGGTLQVEISNLGSDGCWVDGTPHVDFGQGQYFPGSRFIEIAPAGMLSREAWSNFVTAANTALIDAPQIDEDSQLYIIVSAFEVVAQEECHEYFFAGDLLNNYPEILAELMVEGITRSEMLKLLANWYVPDAHAGCPLGEVIEFCEGQYL